MELTFLGTGSAYPSPHRGASCIILRDEGMYWMFDCGEGSQVQLMKSNIKAGRIRKMFITHLHGDHVFGLPGLMCTVSQQFGTVDASERPLVEVYGPHGLRKYLRTSLELSRSLLGYDYVVHEMMPCKEQYGQDWQEWPVQHEASDDLHINEHRGRTIHPSDDHIWTVCETDRFTVQASWLQHKVPCFGFVMQEKETAGKLDVKKLKELNLSPGPSYAQIKAGNSVVTPDGVTINPEDVMGPSRPGRCIVILGDTCDSHKMAPLCQGADVIVHEATLEDGMEENAIEKGHSTPRMAGTFAKSCEAKKLILTHFSQRYAPMSKEAKEGEVNVEVLLEQGKSSFGSDNVMVMDDFMVVTIPTAKS